MNSSLTPEQRVNKLGHVVTKHVKTQVLPAGRKLPAVSLPASDREQLLTKCASRLSQGFNGDMDPTSPQTLHIRRILSTLTSDTIRRIDALDPRRAVLIVGVLRSRDSGDDHVVNDLVALVDFFEENHMLGIETNHYLETLAHFDDLVPQDEDGHCPDERRDQSIAVITVARHMRRRGMMPVTRDADGKQISFIKDDKLRELLLSGEHNRDAVVRIIVERHIFNADQIVELMEGVPPSLLEGSL